MEVVGIVGYKDSGKTTLVRTLARELTSRGYEVAVVKHTSHRLHPPGKDSALLQEVADQVGLVSPHVSGVFWGRPLSLEEILAHLQADVVLVEGFKGEKMHRRIVCLRGEPDDRDLFDGAVICAVGPGHEVAGIDAPVFARDEVAGVVDLLVHAVLLPSAEAQ